MYHNNIISVTFNLHAVGTRHSIFPGVLVNLNTLIIPTYQVFQLLLASQDLTYKINETMYIITGKGVKHVKYISFSCENVV